MGRLTYDPYTMSFETVSDTPTADEALALRVRTAQQALIDAAFAARAAGLAVRHTVKVEGQPDVTHYAIPQTFTLVEISREVVSKKIL